MKSILMSQSAIPVAPEPEPDAVPMDDAARRANLSRTLLYDVIYPDKAAAKGLPFLPTVKVGKRRLVRLEALRAWLASIETREA